MDQPPVEKNLLGILHEYRIALTRENREICEQIEPLRERLARNEVELLKVQRALVAAGDTESSRETTKPESAAELDQRANSIRALAVTIRDTPVAALTIKALLVRALIERSDAGATPAELKEQIEASYGRVIDPGSIRPNLARLRDDGIVVRSIPPKWVLDPLAAKIMGSVHVGSTQSDDAEFWNSPLIKAAIELAWREPT
jgi:hypothetical protein